MICAVHPETDLAFVWCSACSVVVGAISLQLPSSGVYPAILRSTGPAAQQQNQHQVLRCRRCLWAIGDIDRNNHDALRLSTAATQPRSDYLHTSSALSASRALSCMLAAYSEAHRQYRFHLVRGTSGCSVIPEVMQADDGSPLAHPPRSARSMRLKIVTSCVELHSPGLVGVSRATSGAPPAIPAAVERSAMGSGSVEPAGRGWLGLKVQFSVVDAGMRTSPSDAAGNAVCVEVDPECWDEVRHRC